MKAEKALEKLGDMFKEWGLGINDWVLIAHYALRFQGYKVKLRRGHFNTIVDKSKLPWKIGEGYEIFPPKGSRWAREFSHWMKLTSFDTDLIIHSPQKLKEIIEDTILYQLPNKKRVRILTMRGSLKILDEYLVHCKEEEVGEEKGRYLLKRLEDMCRAAKEKGDSKNVCLIEKVLKKYNYLRRAKKFLKKKANQFKGMVAYKGKVKGKVKIVSGKGDRIGKVSKGEILVTKMTSAKFISIIGKIKAIVTDDGGILCHAAILSREFKIPCIVGTKIATKVLKDGDLIEVDANRGIVRILK
jgi:phosphoenolpyruvate synthase/pyruvate phosphate dikinase